MLMGSCMGRQPGSVQAFKRLRYTSGATVLYINLIRRYTL